LEIFGNISENFQGLGKIGNFWKFMFFIQKQDGTKEIVHLMILITNAIKFATLTVYLTRANT